MTIRADGQIYDIKNSIPEVGDKYGCDDNKVVKVEEVWVANHTEENQDYDCYEITTIDCDGEELKDHIAVAHDYSSYRKLFYIRTNGYDLVASVNWEGELVGYLTQTEGFPLRPDVHEAIKFLESIEDDSSWETDVDDVDDLISDNEVLVEWETEL